MAKPFVCEKGEEKLYHGTSVESANEIMKHGFVPDKKYNWNVKSKKGFVYLSKAYAPFYAMAAKSKIDDKRVIVGTCIPEKKLYPEDDFIMCLKGKPAYSQEELDEINLLHYKTLYKASLQYLGNASAKPRDVRVMGMSEFDTKGLIMTCDPVISPKNYEICGEYYKALSDWLYEGKNHMVFPRIHEWLMNKK